MRAARRRWASGVGVITTAIVEGDITSFRGSTVSAFLVVSLDPPMVLVSLEQGSRMSSLVPTTGNFAISILDRAHEFLSDRFSGYGPQPDERFTGLTHVTAETGAPLLDSALAWFDCEVDRVLETGDHVTILGRVVAVGVGEDTDDPLLSYEGAYRRIEGA
jgi:flavin reductase (DIM6/NTAB) family NADH-FMN oxidoreductase RutF